MKKINKIVVTAGLVISLLTPSLSGFQVFADTSTASTSPESVIQVSSVATTTGNSLNLVATSTLLSFVATSSVSTTSTQIFSTNISSVSNASTTATSTIDLVIATTSVTSNTKKDTNYSSTTGSIVPAVQNLSMDILNNNLSKEVKNIADDLNVKAKADPVESQEEKNRRNDRRIEGKLKNHDLDSTKKTKLFAKIALFEKKQEQSPLLSEIQNLKTSRKNRGGLANNFQDDSQKDFQNLKKLNDKIVAQNKIDTESTFTAEDLKDLKTPEADVLFMSDAMPTLPNDPQIANDWAVEAINNEYSNSFTTVESLGRPVVVAVIDSGVEYTHEDLNGAMWSAANCVDSNNIPLVGSCTNGYDFVDNDKDPAAVDGADHGTAVATLIGARTDNGKGIASLSQNRVKIMSLRVADSGIINLNNLIKAVYFAVYNGADVINMSLSGPSYSQGLYDALSVAKTKGIKVIVSAGNAGMNIDATPVYPASYNLTNIYAVGSLDQSGAVSSFSNYGTSTVRVLAPGRDVMAGTIGNSYSLHSGTSFSAPIFTALVSRWISEKKDVDTELGNLHSNQNQVSFAKNGKTLALSRSQSPTASTDSPRFVLITSGANTGKYTDTVTGSIVSAEQTYGLDLQNDTSIGMPYEISPGSSVSPGPTVTLSPTGGCLTFSWQAVSGAGTYGLYITNTSTNVSLFFNANLGLVTSQYVCGISAGSPYRWNTSARKNPSIVKDNNTNLYYFTASNPVPANPTGYQPNTPNYPGQLTTVNSQTISWNSVPAATYYSIDVRDLYSNVLNTYIVYSTNYTFSNLINGHNYKWDLQACNSAGCSDSLAYNYYFYYQAPIVNQPPTVPTFSGPSSGYVGVSYSYTLNATDPNSDNVGYYINWNDGAASASPSLVASGVSQTFTHTFTYAGTFCVLAYANDSKGAPSSWTPCQYINITQQPVNQRPDLVVTGVDFTNKTYSPGESFSVNVSVKNSGATPATAGYKTGIYLNSLRLGEVVGGALAAGSSETKSVNITLPAQSSSVYYGSGNYTLQANVDDGGAVLEINENNNTYSKNITTYFPNVSQNLSLGNVGDQIAGTSFNLSFSNSGYPIGSTVYLDAPGNVISPTYFTLSSGGQTVSLQNSNSWQQIKYTINGTTYYSNSFAVTSSKPPTGSVTIYVQDKTKKALPGATVKIEPCALLIPVCGNAVQKVTDASGKAFFTAAESGGSVGDIAVTVTATYGTVTATTKDYISRSQGITFFVKQTVFANVDTTHTPVILLPGIMGSSMKGDKFLLPYLNGDMTPDASKLQISDSFGDWGADYFSKSLGWELIRTKLESLGYVRDQTIIDCPYDWRMYIEKSMNQYLKSCIEKAKKASGKDKVDIIAHSMGGLLARAYIQDNNGADAANIRKIAFLGTPHLGSSDAYNLWEGAETGSLVRDLVIKRLVRNDPVYEEKQNTALQKAYLDSASSGLSLASSGILDYYYKLYVVRDLLNNKVPAVKQLLPVYPFLNSHNDADDIGSHDRGYKESGASKIVNLVNQNEFLVALDRSETNCLDGSCNEGSLNNGAYNFKDFKQATIDAGIIVKMFYGETHSGLLGFGPVNPKSTKNILKIRPNAPTLPALPLYPGLYEDGIPDYATDGNSNGDTTVPVRSSLEFFKNTDGTYWASPQTANAEHQYLPREFVNQTAFFVSDDSAALSGITTNDVITPIMNITTDKGVSAYLVNPNGQAMGVNPSTQVAENSMPGIKKLQVDGDGSTFSIENPVQGTYTLYLFGPQKTDYNLYTDFGSDTNSYINEDRRYNDGTTTQIVKFTVNPTPVNVTQVIIFEKIKNVPTNVVLKNVSGTTNISFLAPVGIIPIKYNIYSRSPSDAVFTLLTQTATTSFQSTDAWAGANASLEKIYRVSAVFADGTESFLTDPSTNNDSDWDGISDTNEITAGTKIDVADTDGDGLVDGLEVYVTKTDPLKKDTDGNGIGDYEDSAAKFGFKPRVLPQTLQITSFTASPTIVSSGATTTLSWSIASGTPTTLTIDNGVGSVLGTTTKVVTPATSTTFTLTAVSASGTTTKSVIVNVTKDVVSTIKLIQSGIGSNSTTSVPAKLTSPVSSGDLILVAVSMPYQTISPSTAVTDDKGNKYSLKTKTATVGSLATTTANKGLLTWTGNLAMNASGSNVTALQYFMRDFYQQNSA